MNDIQPDSIVRINIDGQSYNGFVVRNSKGLAIVPIGHGTIESVPLPEGDRLEPLALVDYQDPGDVTAIVQMLPESWRVADNETAEAESVAELTEVLRRFAQSRLAQISEPDYLGVVEAECVHHPGHRREWARDADGRWWAFGGTHAAPHSWSGLLGATLVRPGVSDEAPAESGESSK